MEKQKQGDYTMKTITYTNDTGLKFTVPIDALIKKMERKEDTIYCVFFSYRVRGNGQGQTLTMVGSVEDCLAYVLMFSIDAGYGDSFDSGGPSWFFVDSQNVDKYSYDEVEIMPLSRAYEHDGLRKVMADDFEYVCNNVLAVSHKCQIN